MTLSTPVKIVALAALALALGLAGVMMLSKKGSAAATVAPPVVHHTAAVAQSPAATKPKPARHKIVLSPGLPSVVRAGLERRANAVVVIYSSRVPADRAMRAEAAAAARMTHSAFVAANVAINGIAAAVAGWSASVKDPAVIVIRRPGRILFGATGLTDRQTLAQAILAK
jgi:hypothetical protein